MVRVVVAVGIINTVYQPCSTLVVIDAVGLHTSGGAVGGVAPRGLCSRVGRRVFDRRIRGPDLVDDREAHSGTRGERLGVVLHHALQACAALEGGAAGVGVLGVDKLADDPAGRMQLRGVAVQLDHQLVDVA